MLKICRRYAEDMLKICWRYAEDMLKICWRYAEDMLKICWRYAEDMPKICWRYAEDVLKICWRYVEDMLKIYWRYAEDMLKISESVINPSATTSFLSLPILMPFNTLGHFTEKIRYLKKLISISIKKSLHNVSMAQSRQEDSIFQFCEYRDQRYGQFRSLFVVFSP